tara:strand:- start:662 stop:1096 length:435 start_codon:yes stop_codon:yes gene_type:complete
MDCRKDASRLRKQLHRACYEADLAGVREVLHKLYEDERSPLGGTKRDVGTPLSFCALAEVALLAAVLSILDASNENREKIADEMEENVNALYQGFGVSQSDHAAFARALDLCAEATSTRDAQASCEAALAGTSLCKVRLDRHAG